MICPCPHKAMFLTKADAKLWLKEHEKTLKNPLMAYKCPCSRWHLTKKRVSVQERQGIKERANKIIHWRQFLPYINNR